MDLYNDKGTARRWVLQVGTALVLWLVIFDGWRERAAGWEAVFGGWLITWVGLAVMIGAVVAGFTTVRRFFVPPTGISSVDRPAPELEDVSVVAYLSILAVCVALVCVRLLLSAK